MTIEISSVMIGRKRSSRVVHGCGKMGHGCLLRYECSCVCTDVYCGTGVNGGCSVYMLSDLGQPEFGNLCCRHLVDVDVVVGQASPEKVHHDQRVHGAPDEVDTVEEVTVSCAQNDPTVVEDGGQQQAHKKREASDENELAMGHHGILEYGNHR